MDATTKDPGQVWLERFLQLGGVSATVTLEKPRSLVDLESRWLIIDDQTLTPKQVSLLIGRDGAAIDALQYLANTSINLGKAGTDPKAYTIELQGYRVQRHAQLRDLADQAAQAARETQQPQPIKSLSAAERRLIHTYLKQFGDLETVSEGQEPHRFLMVSAIAA
jgi:spoIIIJ-associated protein